MCVNETELKNYKELNKTTRKNSTILFGSTYAKEIPVSELRQNFGIVSNIYNRSLTDLSVYEAKAIVEDILNEICPSKILLQLGEVDLSDEKHSVDDVILEILNVIRTIKSNNKNTKIVLISLNNLLDKKAEKEFNTKLESLAKINNCLYAHLGNETADDTLHINAFKSLKYFFYEDISLQIM